MNKGQKKVKQVLHEYKAGTLHSGSPTGPKVKSRDQAIAISLAEKRRLEEHGRKSGR